MKVCDHTRPVRKSSHSEWVLGSGQIAVKYCKRNGVQAVRHVCPRCKYSTGDLPYGLAQQLETTHVYDAQKETVRYKWWVRKVVA